MAPRAIFIGMPGAGKSTVGRHVAESLGLPFADSDQLIVAAEGRTVEQIFADDGEAGFRSIEARVIADALDNFEGLLALGGGALTTPATRDAVANHEVFLIEADDAVLTKRIVRSHNVRPLLVADPAGGLARLRAERDATYHSVASHVVMSDDRPVAHVVRRVLDILIDQPTTVRVNGDAPYDVLIGRDLGSRVVRQAAKHSAVMVVSAPDIDVSMLVAELKRTGLPTTSFVLPRGEEAKEINVVAQAWEAAGDALIGRDGVVVAVGGGATTDVGGFIAATWLRGIPVIQVPTTLLAMVDAAVGGKTGINSRHGKNLVGSFFPPELVLCDLDYLRTLPMEELRAGMGEVVKCGFIRDPRILDVVAEFGEAVLDPGHPALRELVERSVAVKADVVGQDLKESGLREILNYGHTLAHSIELGENYQRRHGEAVAIGCVFAAALAESEGIAEPGFTDLHRSAFGALGLPTDYAGDRTALEAGMHTDKKVRSGKLRFVVLSGIAAPQILKDPSPEALSAGFDAIGAR